jgi:hypothetical protein
VSDRPTTAEQPGPRDAEDLSARDARLYDAGYYAHYEGGSYDRGGHWTRFFGYIADEVVARWNPARTLDAGCALGVFVEELRRRGVDAWGVDVSEYAISEVPDDIKPYCHQASLASPLPDALPERFDLVSCIEVVEHMEPGEGQRAIEQLCRITDRVLFSSTPDGFAEPTHFTVRPAEEWSAIFARHGFVRDFGAEATFLAPWAVVYVRREMTPYQLVLEYDRQYSRVLEERRQLRQHINELDRALNGMKTEEPQAYAGDPGDEVARLRVELMAARDALAGAEAVRRAEGIRSADERRAAEERAYDRARADLVGRLRPSRPGRAALALGRRIRALRS